MKSEDMTTAEAAEKISNGEYASAYQKMEDSEPTGAIEGAGDEAYVPRVIYSADDKIDLSKLDIPLLRLAQGMTSEVADKKAQIGQFVLTNYPPYDDVVLVPLAAQQIRVYKPDPKQPPKCVAPQGVHGVGDPGIKCSDCALSKWGPRDPKTGKSTKPPCAEGVSVRAYSLTHRTLLDFQFMKADAGKGGFIQKQSIEYGWAGFAIKLGAGATKNDRGQWYVPTIEMMAEVPEEHRDRAYKWLEIVRLNIANNESMGALEAAIQDAP